METIKDITALEAHYGAVSERSLTKVVTRMTPLYRTWIEASRFCILSTVGADGVHGSPRGDDGPVVKIADDKTIWMPDWRGNNRLDCLKNIVRDDRVSLMFMVAGSNSVVRVNGRAVLTADPKITGAFEQGGKHPKTVIVLIMDEMYFQCAKALMRADLWGRDDAGGLPSAGQFLKEREAMFDADGYDSGYAEYAKERMW